MDPDLHPIGRIGHSCMLDIDAKPRAAWTGNSTNQWEEFRHGKLKRLSSNGDFSGGALTTIN